MINYFKNIGEQIAKTKTSTGENSELDEKLFFLNNISILPNKKNKEKKEYLRAIAIDFDLEKGTFKFELDEELIPLNREYFFAFKAQGPNSKKIYFATNNVNYLYKNVFVDSIGYMREYDKKLFKISEKDSKFKVFFDFLKKIKNKFYRSGKLSVNKLETIQKDKLTPDKDFNKLLKDMFPGDMPNIFIIKFNGQTIMEYENGKYKEAYINILYHQFSVSGAKEKDYIESICHICGKKRKVLKTDKSILMKFYNPTELFSEKLDSKKAYKSFAMCEDCGEKVRYGMNYVQDYLKRNILSMSAILIPHINNADNDMSDFRDVFWEIFNLFNLREKSYSDMISKIKKMVQEAKFDTLYFDILFYFSPPASQQFIVNKLISNVELNSLSNKMRKFDEISEKYHLDDIRPSGFSQTVNLNFLRYTIFPSKYSHSSNKPELYRKNLLDFLATFINGQKFDYRKLIRDFMYIAHHKFNKDKDMYNKLDAFKMILFFKMLIELKQIKGFKNTKKEIEMKTKPPEKFQEFFEVHTEVYEDFYKQGLFLLGVLINRIVYAQKGKSSNFLSKINFGGISSRKVQSLVNQVKEYTLIYKDKMFEEGEIWAAITERLQSIETSDLSGTEVVFYILTGQSYAMYLGITQSKEKNLEEK